MLQATTAGQWTRRADWRAPYDSNNVFVLLFHISAKALAVKFSFVEKRLANKDAPQMTASCLSASAKYRKARDAI